MSTSTGPPYDVVIAGWRSSNPGLTSRSPSSAPPWSVTTAPWPCPGPPSATP